MAEHSVSDLIIYVNTLTPFGRRNLVHALATTDAVEHMQVASDLAQAEGRADLTVYRDVRDVAAIERLESQRLWLIEKLAAAHNVPASSIVDQLARLP